MTYEGVLALATYLRERLAVKPIGFRDVAVEMNAGQSGDDAPASIIIITAAAAAAPPPPCVRCFSFWY